MKLRILLAASALALLPTLQPAQADTTSNLRIFRDVCLVNAPAFDEDAILQAAQKQTIALGNGGNMGNAEWLPGRQCKIGSRTGANNARPPTVTEVEALVVETYNRLGGGKFTMKRIKKDSMQYRMVTPAGRFEISVHYGSMMQKFYISKL